MKIFRAKLSDINKIIQEVPGSIYWENAQEFALSKNLLDEFIFRYQAMCFELLHNFEKLYMEIIGGANPKVAEEILFLVKIAQEKTNEYDAELSWLYHNLFSLYALD